MPPLHLAFTPRFVTLTGFVIATLACLVALVLAWDQAGWLAPVTILCAAVVGLGIRDLAQTRHAILRNYPIAAHLCFLLEEIRPEMRQYFFEDEKHGTPFSRDKRGGLPARQDATRQAALRHPVRGLRRRVRMAAPLAGREAGEPRAVPGDDRRA